MMDVHSNNEDLNESDPRSNVHYLGSGENKAWKKIQAWTDRPVQAWIFFRPYFHHCLSSAHYCEDHFHSRLYLQFKYMTFIYSQPMKTW